MFGVATTMANEENTPLEFMCGKELGLEGGGLFGFQGQHWEVHLEEEDKIHHGVNPWPINLDVARAQCFC